MHLSVAFGCLWISPVLRVQMSHPDSSPGAPQEECWESVSEGLPEVVAHEGINQRVDGGVAVGQAVAPNFQLKEEIV